MSKTKKAVIIGSVLVGIGVIIGFIGIAIGGFKFPNGAVDLTTMKALHAEKKTVQIADAFDKIEIAGASSMDIEICKSKTGKNYVEYYDTDDWTSHVDVKEHVLKFTTDDKGKHKAVVSLGFGKDTAARLYLADAEYKEISVTTLSGYVTIQDVNAETVNVSASSGDLYMKNINAPDSIMATSSSGDIDLENATAKQIELGANSGDIEMQDITAESLRMSTSSGDIDLADATAKQMELKASSGDIDLERCDAEGFDITTSSGDVDMEITAGRTYRFETKTNSGAVDVPDGDADSDYLCKIVTSSGDVDVKQK